MKRIAFSLLFFALSFPLSAAEVTVNVRDQADNPLSNAVVYLEPDTKPKQGVLTDANIEQKNKQFSPFVSVVQVGTSVNFPNKDSVRHHVYSFSPIKTFELKLYSGIPAKPVVFDKPGTVVLGCNIHDNMLAYIHIVDTPYYGKSDLNGVVKLKDIPSGQYALKIWYYATVKENFITEQKMTIKDDATAVLKLETRN